MPGLLIIAHAPLASALYGVAAHVYPDDLGGVRALDVPPDWSAEQVEQAARGMLEEVRHPQALILSDVFGATPCNVAQRLADGTNVRVVTGVNVPMMWRALSYLREPLDTLVPRAVAGGTQGVMQVAAQRPQTQTQSSRLHDQDDAHHQQ